ncbi:hypothetical protein Scep_012619 [Stephania cephalantha]|uniref:Uncharacterized protein n=1 Tax=Stephania cephalantha TaxID=152367 RepID=A0AAP0PA09_9MAGN
MYHNGARGGLRRGNVSFDFIYRLQGCFHFLSRESAISWLQMIGTSMLCVGGIIETPPKTWTATHLHEDEIRVSRWL